MTEVRLNNLEAEMKRKKISRSDIARTLGRGYSECVQVRDTYFPDMELSYLFETVKTDEM